MAWSGQSLPFRDPWSPLVVTVVVGALGFSGTRRRWLSHRFRTCSKCPPFLGFGGGVRFGCCDGGFRVGRFARRDLSVRRITVRVGRTGAVFATSMGVLGMARGIRPRHRRLGKPAILRTLEYRPRSSRGRLRNGEVVPARRDSMAAEWRPWREPPDSLPVGRDRAWRLVGSAGQSCGMDRMRGRFRGGGTHAEVRDFGHVNSAGTCSTVSQRVPSCVGVCRPVRPLVNAHLRNANRCRSMGVREVSALVAGGLGLPGDGVRCAGLNGQAVKPDGQALGKPFGGDSALRWVRTA